MVLAYKETTGIGLLVRWTWHLWGILIRASGPSAFKGPQYFSGSFGNFCLYFLRLSSIRVVNDIDRISSLQCWPQLCHSLLAWQEGVHMTFAQELKYLCVEHQEMLVLLFLKKIKAAHSYTVTCSCSEMCINILKLKALDNISEH